MSKKPANVPVAQDTGSPEHPVSPWTGFTSLRDEIERLFDAFEPRQWFDRRSAASGLAGREFPLCPAVDLTENEKSYSVTAELPGLEPDAIQVKVSNGTLTISGEKTEQKEEHDTSHHLSERRWGSFQRSIRMPENVDTDKIDAKFSNGVLTIQIPKSAAALASEKTISVKAA